MENINKWETFINEMSAKGIVKLQPILDEEGYEIGAIQHVLDQEQYDIELAKFNAEK